MRPASEMSRVSTAMPEPFVNARTMGRNESVASAGASSVHVHMIVDGLVVMNLYLLMSPGCRQAPAGPEGPAESLSLFEARARRCARLDPGAGTACAENPTPPPAACAVAGNPVAAGARLAVK